MLAPLLKIAAASMAARRLRQTAGEAAHYMLMSVVGAIAASVAVLCLSGAAFVLLRDQYGSAAAWGVLGGFYALAALVTFLFRRSRRGV